MAHGTDATLEMSQTARVGWGERVFVGVLVVLWVAVAAYALAGGIDYYRLSLADRAYSPLYRTYNPTGTLGHPFGIVGTAMIFVGVATYSIRKRSARLAKLGRLRHWLQFHIFLCTLGPFLVLLHTSFKIGGLVSIAFWSMAVVVASGVFGRYLYARIPKTINGRFLTLQAIDAERKTLLAGAAERAGLDASKIEAILPARRPQRRTGPIRALLSAAVYDLTRKRRLRVVRRQLHALRLPRATQEAILARLRDEMDLEQQVLLLDPFRRLFGYWHLLHLPLALVMLLIVIVHVVVAVVFGYGWLL